LIRVLNKINEKDDGIFDWMSVMDTTKREKVKKPETDKANVRVISSAKNSPAPPSPLITNAHGSHKANNSAVNSPLTKDPVNAKSPLGNAMRKPTIQQGVPSTPAETQNLKKKSFFQRIFSCMGAKD